MPTRSVPALVVALAAVVVYGVYLAVRLQELDGDRLRCVIAGAPFADPSATPPNLYVFPAGTSYDGQFFYRLALEPWSSMVTAYGISVDLPAYRAQRILHRYWCGCAQLGAGSSRHGRVLAKETNLLMPLAGLLLWCCARPRKTPVVTWIVPIAACMGWSTIVGWRWGAPAFVRAARISGRHCRG